MTCDDILLAEIVVVALWMVLGAATFVEGKRSKMLPTNLSAWNVRAYSKRGRRLFIASLLNFLVGALVIPLAWMFCTMR